MDFFDVYLMKIGENDILHTFGSEIRMAELAACKNRALYASKCASWTLLARAFAHTMGKEVDFSSFSRLENGKWVCRGAHFSLSHTGDFCAAVISNAACGIDIEDEAAFLQTHNETHTAKLKAQILAPGEDADTDFLTLWTKKESIYKCKGAGGFAPREIAACAHAARAYRLLPYGLTLAVCGEKSDNIRFFLLRAGKIESAGDRVTILPLE